MVMTILIMLMIMMMDGNGSANGSGNGNDNNDDDNDNGNDDDDGVVGGNVDGNDSKDVQMLMMKRLMCKIDDTYIVVFMSEGDGDIVMIMIKTLSTIMTVMLIIVTTRKIFFPNISNFQV